MEEAVTNGQTSRLDDLAPSLRAHVNLINEFQLQHNDDDRTVLFEKERRRLQQAMQLANISLTHQHTTAQGAKPSSMILGDINTEVTQTPSATKVKKSGGRPAPLYAWELAEVEGIEREPITNEHGTFLPTTTKGIYNKVGEDDVGTRHIDFQVVLTPDELMTIVSRQRAIRVEQIHRQRLTVKRKESRLGIMASSPYLDSKRVLKDIYRHDHPDKWTNRKGFVSVGPALKSLKAQGSMVT